MSSYKKTYTTQTAKSNSPSQAIEDSKKKTSLLKDNSWIRKDAEEDEPVDRDPNFAKTILSRYRSNESLPRSEPEETKSPTVRTSSSVHALTKRFSASQDELNKSSSLHPNKSTTRSTTTTTVTKDGKTTETTTTQSLSRSPGSITPTKTGAFSERVFSDVKSSSKGTPYSSYTPPKTTKVTEATATSNKDAEDKLYDTLILKSVKDDSPATDSKTSFSKTEIVTVKSSSNGDGIKTITTTRTSSTAEDDLYDTLLPTSMKSPVSDGIKTITTTRTSSTAEDDLYDTLLPKSMTSPVSDGIKTITTTRTSSTTEDDLYDTLLPKSMKSPVSDGIKTTTTTRTSSTTEDDLYDTLLPRSMKSPVSPTSTTQREVVTVDSGRRGDSPPSTRTITSYSSSYSSSDDAPSTRTSSYTISTTPSDEYTSKNSSYTSYSRTDSRVDDLLSDSLFTKSSIKTAYSSPERTVLEKDLCSKCRKPFNSDAKMVLEDMKINCHASCFKCEVCNSTLGHLKAGDSMWIYRRTVHCENCFDVTREKWRR